MADLDKIAKHVTWFRETHKIPGSCEEDRSIAKAFLGTTHREHDYKFELFIREYFATHLER